MTSGNGAANQHGDISQTGDHGVNIAHTGTGNINMRFWGSAPTHAICWVVAAAAIATAPLLLSTDSPPGGTLDGATGTVTLVWQYHGPPAVIFPLASGGIEYCTHSDSRWWLPWSAPTIDPSAPVIGHSTVFASDYSGFEMLGTDDGTLTYAWRGNYLDHFRWHGPGPVLVDGDPLQNVTGRPGFLQYPIYRPAEIPQFLALVPQRAGGLGLYRRVEPGPFDWGPKRLGVVASQLGLINSVTAVRTPDGALVAVLRVGSRLYKLTHPRGNLPADFGIGWSKPTEVRIAAGGFVSVTGDPAFASSEASTSQLDLIAPVPGGLALLTAANSASPWSLQRLPIHQPVESAGVLGGEVHGRLNIDIIYRSGSQLYSIWKWDGGAWHQPAIVTWGPSGRWAKATRP